MQVRAVDYSSLGILRKLSQVSLNKKKKFNSLNFQISAFLTDFVFFFFCDH